MWRVRDSSGTDAGMLLRMMRGGQAGGAPLALGLILLFAVLSVLRPVNHDESQYVAATILARNALPWRDFAYFQTPLQPVLFAPFAAGMGALAWPTLRVLNAALGAIAVLMVDRTARAAGASPRMAVIAAGLFAGTDILLFSAGTARNDALPAAALAGALVLMVRAAQGQGSARHALLTGFLLAVAAGAKISYAIPAAAYFLWALLDRRHRPAMVALGALPIVALIGWMVAQAPEAARFEVLTFPALAPDQMYRDAGRAFKLSLAFKAIDTLKFLALGAALPAIVAVAVRWRRQEKELARLLDVMIVAGLVAALLPEPTWRQYLLPALPPLFVRLALLWQRSPPGRWERVAFVTFFCAGLAPSVEAIVLTLRDGAPMANAVTDGARLAAAMDKQHVSGAVATLSPQYVAATGRPIDSRFAAGPFYFRSHGLLDPASERSFNLVSAGTLDPASLPQAVLVGGDAVAEGGDAALESKLAAAAAPRAIGIERLNGKFTLYVLR
jgi:4-amino-4-deoxy-L-arabinose transferase-like glycosyltransferase